MGEKKLDNSDGLDQPNGEWILFDGKDCWGPFTGEQIIHLILTRQVHRNACLLRDDQKIWRPILDCVNELTSNRPGEVMQKGFERRVAAPRVEFDGQASIVTAGDTFVSRTQDISVSGVFVVTKRTRFKLGDNVKVSVIAENFAKPIDAVATVARHNANSKFPVGYGLKFVEIGNDAVAQISTVVGVRPINEFGDILGQTGVFDLKKDEPE